MVGFIPLVVCFLAVYRGGGRGIKIQEGVAIAFDFEVKE